MDGLGTISITVEMITKKTENQSSPFPITSIALIRRTLTRIRIGQKITKNADMLVINVVLIEEKPCRPLPRFRALCQFQFYAKFGLHRKGQLFEFFVVLRDILQIHIMIS